MAPLHAAQRGHQGTGVERGSRAARHNTLQVAPSTPQGTPPPAPPAGPGPALSTLWGSHSGQVGLLALGLVFPCPAGPVRIRGQGRAVMRSGVSLRAWASLGLKGWRERGSESRGSKLLPDVGTGPAHLHATPAFPMGKAGSCPSHGPWLGGRGERETGCGAGWGDRVSDSPSLSVGLALASRGVDWARAKEVREQVGVNENHPGTPSHGHLLWVPHSGPGMHRLRELSDSKAQKRTGLPGRQQGRKLSCIFSFRLGNLENRYPSPGQ